MGTKRKETKGDRKMKIVIIGPPGSGKGTYSIRLSSKLGIPHLSTGHMFRTNMKNETELGVKVKGFMDAGDLVPDDITNEMVKQRITEPDCTNGFIFDGYPRSLPQAQALGEMTKINVTIYLDIPEDILVEKALARAQCKECGDIYNFADINRCGVRMPPMLPKVEGKCDKCEGELYKRDADNEETIKHRMKVQSVPSEIMEFYEQQGILRKIKVDSPPEEMVPKILEILEEYK